MQRFELSVFCIDKWSHVHCLKKCSTDNRNNQVRSHDYKNCGKKHFENVAFNRGIRGQFCDFLEFSRAQSKI